MFDPTFLNVSGDTCAGLVYTSWALHSEMHKFLPTTWNEFTYCQAFLSVVLLVVLSL